MEWPFRGYGAGCSYCDFYQYAKKDHVCQRGKHMGYNGCGWYQHGDPSGAIAYIEDQLDNEGWAECAIDEFVCEIKKRLEATRKV